MFNVPGTPAWMANRGRAGGIWTPHGMNGLVNQLPLAEGAASSVQLIPDLRAGAGATYRGYTVAVEASDPTWTDEGLSFDGGDICDLGGGSLWDSFTILFAFKTSLASGDQTFYSEGNSANGTPYLLIDTNPGLKLRVGLRDDASGVFWWNSAGVVVTDGVWRTAAVVFRPTSLQVWTDGVSAASVNHTQGATTFDLATLGALRRNVTSSYVTGDMAYVMRWNRELADSEIILAHNYIRDRVAGRGITLPVA